MLSVANTTVRSPEGQGHRGACTVFSGLSATNPTWHRQGRWGRILKIFLCDSAWEGKSSLVKIPSRPNSPFSLKKERKSIILQGKSNECSCFESLVDVHRGWRMGTRKKKSTPGAEQESLLD